MEIPTEILAAIVALLTYKPDLAAVRLVNKAFAAVGAVQLFKTIRISPAAREVEDAQSMYENFGAHIRTIIISGAFRSLNSFDLHSPESNDMKAWVRSVLREAPQPPSNLHLRHLAAVQTLICEERKVALTPNGLERFLRQVFKYAPRVERVRFSNFPRDKEERREDGSLVKPYKPCAEPHCLEAQEKVYDILRIEFSEPDLEDMKARIRSAIQTISRSGAVIRELEFWRYSSSLSIPKGNRGTLGKLPYLTTLYLVTDVECDGKNRVSAWLAASTQLEKLYIKINSRPRYNDRSTTTLNEVLAICRFPKLKTLLLQEFDSDSQGLLRFLQSCGALEQVVLLDYNLHDNTSESWHRVLDEIRNTARLEPIKNIEDLASYRYDESRKKPDDWVMEPWEDTKRNQLRFLSESLMVDYHHAMFRIYLWGGHGLAKGGDLDEYLFSSHRYYK